jgi:hypothetical protein
LPDPATEAVKKFLKQLFFRHRCPFIAIEPRPKKTKSDTKTLTNDDLDSIRKMMLSLDKTLRLKNQQNLEMEEELKSVKAVVKRDASYRIFVKRIAMHVPLEVIKDKFSFFGRIMDIEENPRASGIKRSVFITFFEREAVQMTLTTKSLVLIGENLKVMA